MCRDGTSEISRHTRFHDLRHLFLHLLFIIIFFFFSKPAISILERVDALIFLLNVSRVGGDVHGPQAIVSFRLHVSTLPCGALHGKQKTTPFSASSACVTAGSRDIAACVFVWNRLPVAGLATLGAFHCYFTVSL